MKIDRSPKEKIKFTIFPKKCEECGEEFVFEKMKMRIIKESFHSFVEKEWYCKKCNNYIVKNTPNSLKILM